MLRAVGVRAASQARRQFATAAVATGDLETAVTRAGQRLQMALDAVDFIHDSAVRSRIRSTGRRVAGARARPARLQERGRPVRRHPDARWPSPLLRPALAPLPPPLLHPPPPSPRSPPPRSSRRVPTLSLLASLPPPRAQSQLMLETDPSNRQPREFYVVRYQRFALQELLRSLERVEEIRSKHPDVADKLLAAGNLHIVMADSKLARDKLQHAVISAESRAVTGLYAH